MTFRKQWPQKRTEYPTSNRGKSQKQYFAAKTTADRAHATTRGRQSPTTSTRPHNRTISCAPRTAAVRSPRSRPPTAAPAWTLPAQLGPLACRETGSSRPCQAGGPAASYARRAPPPPRYAIEYGGSRPRPRGGKAWRAPPAPAMCPRVYGGVVECGARRGRAGHPATHARRVDRSPAHAC